MTTVLALLGLAVLVKTGDFAIDRACGGGFR
jgi:hypothetical protein